MDTKSLRLFVLAAEKLNISAAGRQLGMAPAVASARLAKLETTLGADLLHRSTRKVSLSLEGAALLPYAREMLAQEAAARAVLGLDQPVVAGTLRFAASSTFAQQYIVPLLPLFLAQYPGLKLDLRLSDTPFDLIEGSFDLALRNTAMSDSGFRGRKLADDQRILCASPGYLKEHGTPRSPSDLETHQLLAFRTSGKRVLLRDDGTNAVFDPKKSACRLMIDDGFSHKIATCAGAGIAAHSLWSVHRELAGGELVRVLPDYVVDEKTAIWLVYPKSNVLTAKVRVFIDFLVEHIGRKPAWLQSEIPNKAKS